MTVLYMVKVINSLLKMKKAEVFPLLPCIYWIF